MRRSVAVYGALFVASMVGAYLSWTYEGETTASSEPVVIDQFERGDIAAIRYETDEKTFRLQTRSDDFGDYVWVVQKNRSADEGGSATETSQGDGADAGMRDTSETGRPEDTGPARPGRPLPTAEDGNEEDDEPKRVEYKAGPAVEELFDNLDPLEASRTVSPENAEEREAFGFDDPYAELTLELADGGEREFTIGGYSFGRRHLYLRDENDGAAYVLDAGFIGPVEYPKTRLREHRLLGEQESEVARVAVESAGREVELVQQNRDDPSAAYWSIGAGDDANPSAGSWVGKLLGLRIESFVPDDPPDNLERALGARVEPDEGKPVDIEVFRGPGGDRGRWYARSNYTRSLVRLNPNRASGIVDDLQNVIESEEPETTPPEDR